MQLPQPKTSIAIDRNTGEPSACASGAISGTMLYNTDGRLYSLQDLRVSLCMGCADEGHTHTSPVWRGMSTPNLGNTCTELVKTVQIGSSFWLRLPVLCHYCSFLEHESARVLCGRVSFHARKVVYSIASFNLQYNYCIKTREMSLGYQYQSAGL